MRHFDDTSAERAPRRRIWTAAAVLAAASLALSGCGLAGAQGEFSNGYLPHGVTESSSMVERLWVNSWIAALAVGLLVWGLIVFCIVVFRRRSGDNTLPEQLRYNVPIEILYTVVPMFMIAVLFAYTAKYETELLSTTEEPDVVVNVVGKQWSWDFNYVNEGTFEAGTHAQLTGEPGVEETLPTLYLPVNQRVEFVLTARDVIHSFWVPVFLQKLDMIPGRVNRFQVVPTETGTFAGKCAELCGAYHSQMLFNVKVVEQAEYDAHIAELKAAGNEGQLENNLNREEILPQDQPDLPTTGSN